MMLVVDGGEAGTQQGWRKGDFQEEKQRMLSRKETKEVRWRTVRLPALREMCGANRIFSAESKVAGFGKQD